jgi:cytosol alanyl aminopeptidase
MMLNSEMNMRLVSSALAAATLLAAAEAPKLRLSEAQQIAPTGYRATLSLDPAKDDFDGSIQIRVDVRKATPVVWLNASRITVKTASVTAGGKKIAAKAEPVNDQFLRLDLASELPPGAATIDLAYTGKIRAGDTAGIFRTEDKGNRYLLTQFQATDARTAFPCFDEPGYKVPWQLTIRVPAGQKAVSNTTAKETTAGGVTTHAFAETKPLPSYLIAFGVGPFEFVDAGRAGVNRVPIRIVTPKGRAAEAKYAASVTATIITRLEEYFGTPFPYEKSDQVAVPTQGFGAMENAGMVTYAQNILLADPARDTPNRQRNYAIIAAHELAHQWFGDLVTTEWWDDIWLNEAFATWMEQKLVREWKPEWKMEMDDVSSKLGAQRQDSLMSARQIRQPIESNDDIQNAFDGITYQKGAAVIGMFEQWMGPETFRRGVQAYMKRFAHRTATSGAFLDELSGASKLDVAKSFSTFLNQAGIPMVSVTLDCGGAAPVLHLEQSRFVPAGSKAPGDQTWRLPVCVGYGSGDHRASDCALMTEARMDLPVAKLGSCPAWVNANEQAKGYYLPEYRGGLLDALIGAGQRHLSPAERVDVIGGASLLSRAGRLAAAQSLRLVEAFHADPERKVVESALGMATAPRMNLVPEHLAPNHERFVRKNFQARARELGWTPRANDPEDVRLLRGGLLAAVATVGGDRALADEARRLAERWLEKRDSVEAEVLGSVLQAAGFHGDLALMQRFLAAYQSTQDRQDQQRLMNAMLAFRDPKAIKAGMQAVISGKIPLQDGFTLILSAGRRSAETIRLPFEFVKTHLDEIMKDKPNIFGFDFGGFLPRVGEPFCDARSRADLQAFFGPLVGRYTGAPRALAQTLESIDQCIANKAAQQPSIIEFLQQQ